MVQTRMNGPLGGREDISEIDPGTLARTLSPMPGPEGLRINLGIAMQLKSTKRRKKSTKRRKKQSKTGITIHAKSQINAATWVKKIKGSAHVPDHFQDQILSKGDLIAVTNPKNFRVPDDVFAKMWRDHWLSAFVNTEWEMTSGCLNVTVTKNSSGPVITVTHNPDLSNGESLSGFTKFTMTNTYHSLHSVSIEKGNTLPTGVKLNSDKKLIVIANRIELMLGKKLQKFEFTDDELVSVWFHEIACHAGRNSEGIADSHLDDEVNMHAKDIDEVMFKGTRTTLPKLQAAMRKFLE